MPVTGGPQCPSVSFHAKRISRRSFFLFQPRPQEQSSCSTVSLIAKVDGDCTAGGRVVSLNQFPAAHEKGARKWTVPPWTVSVYRDFGPEQRRILCCDRRFVVLVAGRSWGRTTRGAAAGQESSRTMDSTTSPTYPKHLVCWRAQNAMLLVCAASSGARLQRALNFRGD